MEDRKPKPLFTLFRAILLLFTGDDSPKKPFLPPRSDPKNRETAKAEELPSFVFVGAFIADLLKVGLK